MVSNAAKALLSPFGTEIQDFCSDIYYDIEKSPKQEIFSECAREPKSLVRPISSRFLQMLDMYTRVEELIDVLVIYYYHVVPLNEEHKYRWMITQVLQRMHCQLRKGPEYNFCNDSKPQLPGQEHKQTETERHGSQCSSQNMKD
ncbi:hypothetical protein ILYODFUR_019733 [Ilyodon furcidens]|uniref:Uncharacterized protein n=1 Tax=Ilyodon furcidens TaxID=33524 RepID=A0ABV0UAZ5_9TELE